MTTPIITNTRTSITHTLDGAEPLTGRNWRGEPGTTIAPTNVEVIAYTDGTTMAFVEGPIIRKGTTGGTASKRRASVWLALETDTTPHPKDVPVGEQPSWLRELVKDSLRALDAADRESVLHP